MSTKSFTLSDSDLIDIRDRRSPGTFFIIDKALVDLTMRNVITYLDYFIYNYFVRYCDEKGQAYGSIRYFAKCLKVGTQTVSKSFQSLENIGLIHFQGQRKTGQKVFDLFGLPDPGCTCTGTPRTHRSTVVYSQEYGSVLPEVHHKEKRNKGKKIKEKQKVFSSEKEGTDPEVPGKESIGNLREKFIKKKSGTLAYKSGLSAFRLEAIEGGFADAEKEADKINAALFESDPVYRTFVQMGDALRTQFPEYRLNKVFSDYSSKKARDAIQEIIDSKIDPVSYALWFAENKFEKLGFSWHFLGAQTIITGYIAQAKKSKKRDPVIETEDVKNERFKAMEERLKRNAKIRKAKGLNK